VAPRLRRDHLYCRGKNQPVRFEISKHASEAVLSLVKLKSLVTGDYLFSSNRVDIDHMSTRQYVRVEKNWVSMIGIYMDNTLEVAEQIEI